MTNMNVMPLRWGNYRVVIVSSLGQIAGSAIATLVGIVIPMIQLILHPELSILSQGILASLNLIGIMIGSVIIGKLSDKYGYLSFFRLSPVIILIGSLAGFMSGDNIYILGIGLFSIGFGAGGDYCLDSDYISELMPDKWKLFMVGVAKAACAFGNILVCLVCFFLMKSWNNPHMWNHLMLTMTILSAIMILARIPFAQSPRWLMANGKKKEAEKAVKYFLGSDININPLNTSVQYNKKIKVSWLSLFKGNNLNKVIFSGIPWACEGFGVYGIGVFMPMLLMSMGLHPEDSGKYNQILWSVQMSTYINLFVLIGFVIGLSVARKIYHVMIETLGFIFCSIGAFIMLIAYQNNLSPWISIAGFMIFELFLNGGPRLITFIIPPQIYNITDRSTGTGIADFFGKAGAVIGVFVMPTLLASGGAKLVLSITIIINIAGAAVSGFVGRKVLPESSLIIK